MEGACNSGEPVPQGRLPMQEPFDYRTPLMTAVHLLLEGTPEARADAIDILKSCPTPHAASALNAVVWDTVIVWLSDTEVQADTEFLGQIQGFLHGDPSAVMRGYVC